MKYKIIFFVFVLAAVCSIAINCIRRNTLNSELTHNTLIIGTCDDYPPYAFNQAGKIVGFDIDLVNELALRMTKRIELKNMSFDILLLELKQGKIHMVAAGISPTQERSKYVYFSNNYQTGDPLIALQLKEHEKEQTDSDTKANTLTLTDLKNKTIGVNEGYQADRYISEHAENLHSNLVRITSVAEAILALKNKQIDLFVTAQSVMAPYFKNHQTDNFSLRTLEGAVDNYALAISKQYPDLLIKVNAALTELEEDGTLADIKKRWNIS